MTRYKYPLLALTAALISGCNLGYYLHSARGQMDLMAKRVPVSELIADPSTPAGLRQRLMMLRKARAFASDRLGLPENESYRSYADLERPFAVWSVVATPEFSLDPVTWCFPFTGCVSYRGYFDRSKAEAFARAQKRRGRDVSVRGVAAYSTLGYFDDPVLNTMMHWDDLRLVGIVFHELAHQVYYVRDDTAFNESFASVVEEQGLQIWLRQEDDAAGMLAYRRRQADERCFRALIADARSKLTRLYSSPADEAVMRREKAAHLGELVHAYARAREAGAIDESYDAWFAQDLNNAHLAAVGAYQQWVPALSDLFRRSEGDFARFYREVGMLAAMSAEDRRRALAELEPGDRTDGCVEAR